MATTAQKSSILPSDLSEIETDLDREKILFYGAPGTGKTTTANRPDTLFLATEPGQSKMRCFKLEIDSWAKFIAACKELKAGDHQFKRVVIDTVDKLYLLCARAKCKQLNIEHESDLEAAKGYQIVNREFEATLQAMATLNMGLIFISHEKLVKIKTRTEEYMRAQPNLSGKPASIIEGFVDHILRFTIEPDPDSLDKERHMILCEPSKFYLSKSRGDRAVAIFTENMETSYAALQAEYEKGIKNLLEATKDV